MTVIILGLFKDLRAQIVWHAKLKEPTPGVQSNFPMRVESGLPDTLASIAMISKTDISEVKALADNLQKAMMNLLEGITDPDPAFPFPDGQIVENRLGFPGLLHQDKTDQVMQRLDAKYKQVRPCLPWIPNIPTMSVRFWQAGREPPWADELLKTVSAYSLFSSCHNHGLMLMSDIPICSLQA